MAPEVSVLIVGYRNRPHLGACLRGALASVAGLDAEFLFIDCSDDGSTQFIRESFPRVQALEPRGNLGFGVGNNLLASHAKGALLLLLNPDTVPRSDELARLVRFARSRPEAGAVGGRCVRPDGRADSGSHQPMLTPSGMLLTAIGLGRLRPGALPESATGPHRVAVISGAFMLVPRPVWEAVGGFDPRFFLYAEELDLCHRISRSGRPLWAEPSIVLVHDAGSGDPDDPARRLNLLKGNASFFVKHHGPVMAWLARAAMLLNEVLRLAGAATLLRVVGSPRASRLATRSAHTVRCTASWWHGWRATESHS